MAETKIGGRPADVTKEDGKVKIVFHPMIPNAKHPKANTFTIKLSKSDIDAIKKAL